MKRLRGSDAFLVYSGSDTSPFVTIKVAIYRPAEAGDAPSIDEMRGFVKAGIASAGARRAGMRIMRVPMDLHHPVWIADPDFNPDNHIHTATLPAPGGKAELCDFLSELMGKPLDPDRPLWEIWLLDGLEEGRIAAVFKVHHALADGITVAALIEKSHSKPRRRRSGRTPSEGEAIPDTGQLVRDALVDLAKSYTVEFPRYYRYIKEAREQAAALGKAGEAVVKAFSAPYTIFNAPGGGSGRKYQYETFSLARFKAVSKAFDCTINTLILGVCSEALKRYLNDVDEEPSEDMVTAMPIGNIGQKTLKTLLGSDIQNNQVAVAILPLYNTVPDFRERLEKIKLAAKTAIQNVRRADGRRLDNYLDFMPGTFVRLLNAAVLRQMNRHKAHANVVISNVPGPREPLYALDGRLQMEELLSCGNLQDGANLNITVWSYVDNLSFSLYTRKDMLPEPEKLAYYLREVEGELEEAYLKEPEVVAKR